MSVINPFKILNLSNSHERSIFYCSTEELRDDENQDDVRDDSLVKKSASTNNLTETDSGIGASTKELSRSLDCLEGSVADPEERRKSQTLPNFPTSVSDVEIKRLSLSTAFGSKRITLGRKLSSLITLPTER